MDIALAQSQQTALCPWFCTTSELKMIVAFLSLKKDDIKFKP
jgi:hypothetical protein